MTKGDISEIKNNFKEAAWYASQIANKVMRDLKKK